MGGIGAVAQFFVVAQPAADDPVPGVRGERFEPVEVVHPLLHRDEGRPVETGPGAGDGGRGDRCLAFGVLGAVLVAGQVTPLPVAERGNARVQLEPVAEETPHGPGFMDERPRLPAAQPDPERRRGGRHGEPRPLHGRKRPQPLDPGAEFAEERPAQPHHPAGARFGVRKASERVPGRGGGRAAAESEEPGVGGDLREDSGLGPGVFRLGFGHGSGDDGERERKDYSERGGARPP